MILGIELGSTRIKSVLTDRCGTVIASGSYEWENQLVNGIWSYSLEDVWSGLQASFASLKLNFEKRGEKLKRLDAIGVSAMMHGYLVFDADGKLLTPFRTWRNTSTFKAAEILSKELDFNMPMRWSATHFYQAVLDGEEHVNKVDLLTTLSGYVHWKLTGRKVLGFNDASGMFPMNDGEFVAEKLEKYDKLLKKQLNVDINFKNILPKIVPAGEVAGVLTEEGARLLDLSGELEAGAILCAPEGDAGTGMVATNSVRVGRGNVSAGTSAFAMVVVDKPISKPFPEIDMITTPDGKNVAMIHANNCTTEINAWSDTFTQLLSLYGINPDRGELLTKLFLHSRESDENVGGLTVYNFLAGEHVWELFEGRPLLVRHPAGNLTLANLMQAQIFSAVASLRRGMDILSAEGISVTEICGHGGFFKIEDIGQKAMSAALRAPVTVMKNAGEGGAWGIALLALYCLENIENELSLADFLDEIFAKIEKSTVVASEYDTKKFDRFMLRYEAGIEVERTAVDTLI